MNNELKKSEQHQIQVYEQTKELIQASISKNTEKAYKFALARLQDDLGENEVNDQNLATYITQLYHQGKSPSTISQVVAAVKWTLKHRQTDAEMPITTATLAGIRRDGKERGRGQVDGLLWKDVERVCISAELENTKAGYRDSALIRLMSDCLLRVSEVVLVNCGHIKEKTLHIPISKTDPEGKGQNLYITDQTREIISRYRDMTEITTGALFRYIRRGDHVQTSRLHPHSARRIIQKRAKDVGIDNFISGHSLRVGSVSSYP